MGIVAAFDKLEDRHACLDLGAQAAAVEQFAFARGKEAFAPGMVAAIADGTPRGPHAGLLATSAKGERGILAAVIGMVNHARRSPLPQGRVECREYQFGAQIWVAIAQPTILRLQVSSTSAR